LTARLVQMGKAALSFDVRFVTFDDVTSNEKDCAKKWTAFK